MLNSHCKGKVKNEKIARWRLELACFNYYVVYRPGCLNAAADALSRVCGATSNDNELAKLHHELCHPGVTRMAHFVRSKNLPYSVADVKAVIQKCKVCHQIKPQYVKTPAQTLIKSTQPFERLSIDFKGPIPSATNRRFLLVVIDEYSRFPFAFPCSDVSSSTVIHHLVSLFSMFGLPSYVHSDRGAAFMSRELKDFLHSRGVATSRTTAYNPCGNGQVERYNGIIWQTISLALTSRELPITHWEDVLCDSLHCVRSLLSTATNQTPHERMFGFQRRSSTGNSLPTWLSESRFAYLKRMNRKSKYEPLFDEVELVDTNPSYAHVRFADGRETTVSLRHLSPMTDHAGEVNPTERPISSDSLDAEVHRTPLQAPTTTPGSDVGITDVVVDADARSNQVVGEEVSETTPVPETSPLRRSNRERRQPRYLEDFVG